MSGLSRPQWDLLAFLKAWFAARPAGSRGPGYEAMRLAMGWQSTSQIREHLKAMQRAGFIRWRPNQHHSVELTDGPIAVALPDGMAEAVRVMALAEGITTAKFIETALQERLNRGSFSQISVSRETPKLGPAGSPARSSLG